MEIKRHAQPCRTFALPNLGIHLSHYSIQLAKKSFQIRLTKPSIFLTDLMHGKKNFSTSVAKQDLSFKRWYFFVRKENKIRPFLFRQFVKFL